MKIRKIANYSTGVSSDSLPIGSIISFSSNSIPSNYLLCDGSAVSREQYKQLFDIIGVTYGAGDGNTTFNLPDLKGKVITGLNSEDTEFNTIGKTGGEKEHKLTVDEMPSHRHGNPVAVNNGGNAGQYRSLFATNTDFWSKNDSHNATASTGGDQAHNNLQPYIVTNYIIKAFDDINVNGEVLNQQSNSQTDTYSCDYINSSFSNKMKVLWQNPNPNSEMAAGYEINLNSSDYDFIIWIAKYANNNNYNFSSISYKGYGCLISTIGAVSGNMIRRSLDYINDTKYSAAASYNSLAGASNVYSLPIMAIGVKL